MNSEEEHAYGNLTSQAHHQTVSREEHRDVVNRLTTQEKNMAELTANVASLATAVKSSHEESREHFSKIHSRLDSVSTELSEKGKINWNVIVGIGALILLGLGALASAGVSITNPIAQNTERNTTWIDERSKNMIDDYYQFGKNSAVIENLSYSYNHLDERVHQNERDISRLLERSENNLNGINNLRKGSIE